MLPNLVPFASRRAELLLLLLAALFVGVSTVGLSLTRSGGLSWAHLRGPLIWLLLITLAWGWLGRLRPYHDPFLWPIFALLTGWGLVLQDRLAPDFVGRQTIWVTLAVVTVMGVATLPRSLRALYRYRYTLLVLGLLLLAATFLFGVNPAGYGAALWLPAPFIGGVYFQPSELLKLLMVFFFASYFADRADLLRDQGRRFGALPYLAPLLLMWGFGVLLLVWQRDLGAATLFFLLFLALLYLATGDRRYVVTGVGLLLAAGVIGYLVFDVVALRVDGWWNPWPQADNRAFQIVQSLYALASGGVLGQGVGQGFPTFVPVVHSDFVFAAIGEEWGLLGTLAATTCFAVWVQRGFRLALTARQPFHMYLAAGLTILLGTQTLLIMGGVTKLLPLTGVTLPLVSYGGSSLLLAGVLVGLLLYLSAESPPSFLHQAADD